MPNEVSDLEMIRTIEPPPVEEKKEPEVPEVPEVEVKTEEGKEEEKKEEDKGKELPHPSWSRISQEYPEFFKKFPEIRDLIGREKAYTELFPSVDDAKEIAEKAGDFDILVEKIGEGDLSPVLSSLEDDSLAKLAENFLPSLAKQNEDLYYRVTSPVVDQLLKAAFREGKLKDDENLANAAYWLSKWALGDGKFATGDVTFQPPKTEAKKDTKLEEEKKQFYDEKYNSFKESVLDSCNTQIDTFITKDLADLAPRIQKLVLREVREELASQLQADSSHMSRLRSLWKKAGQVGYVGDSKSRIINTYLERARSLAPSITEKVRSEIAGTKEKSEPTVSLSGKQAQVSGRPIDAKKVDWSKTSEIDAIRGNLALKG